MGPLPNSVEPHSDMLVFSLALTSQARDSQVAQSLLNKVTMGGEAVDGHYASTTVPLSFQSLKILPSFA